MTPPFSEFSKISFFVQRPNSYTNVQIRTQWGTMTYSLDLQKCLNLTLGSWYVESRGLSSPMLGVRWYNHFVKVLSALQGVCAHPDLRWTVPGCGRKVPGAKRGRGVWWWVSRWFLLCSEECQLRILVVLFSLSFNLLMIVFWILECSVFSCFAAKGMTPKKIAI